MEKNYCLSEIVTMRPYQPGDENLPQLRNYTLKEGDMIAFNPKNPSHLWVVTKEQFKNYHEMPPEKENEAEKFINQFEKTGLMPKPTSQPSPNVTGNPNTLK